MKAGDLEREVAEVEVLVLEVNWGFWVIGERRAAEEREVGTTRIEVSAESRC